MLYFSIGCVIMDGHNSEGFSFWLTVSLQPWQPKEHSNFGEQNMRIFRLRYGKPSLTHVQNKFVSQSSWCAPSICLCALFIWLSLFSFSYMLFIFKLCALSFGCVLFIPSCGYLIWLCALFIWLCALSIIWSFYVFFLSALFMRSF